MKASVAILLLILSVSSAFAQQPQPAPLTDWRAGVDTDLSKVSMPREAHMAVYNILQAYERQAQMEKMRQLPPKPVEEQK